MKWGMWDMKPKTSFFSKGIFINSIKRFSWIGIVYFIALFLAVPMKILMRYDKDFKHIDRSINNIFSFNPEIQALLILTVPVLMAIALFTYLHSKKLGDLIHSLPIKREKIYDNYIAIGIMFLIIPLIINGIISIILNLSLNLDKYYTINDVLVWILIAGIINITVFLVSVFVAMITGTSIAQGILTCIILFLPFGLTALLVYNIQWFLYGFSLDYYLQPKAELLSPIIRSFALWHQKYPMTFTEGFIYISICIVLYFLSKYLYKIRKVEVYSNVISFPALKPMFKYGITFCTMLLGGAYFGQTQDSIKWALFGYFIGSLIGYFVSQIIIKKSLYVFKDIKGYIIYSFVIILVLIGSKIDIIGYEKYVPALNDVKNVYFSEYGYQYDENNKVKFYSDRKNIENIKVLHNKIIKNKNKSNNEIDNKRDVRYMTFVYELKSGKRVARSYEIPYKNYFSYLKPIYESREYKKINYEILEIDGKDIDKIVINSNVDPSKNMNLVDPDEIKDAIENLKADINNATYEQMVDNQEPDAHISVLLSNGKEIYFSWHRSYEKFENWLDKKGYIENVKVMPKDISHVIVEKRSSEDVYGIEENKSSDSLKITDKSQIDTCLKSYTQRIDEETEYIIGFYLDNGGSISATFDNNNIPDFVKHYFNK